MTRREWIRVTAAGVCAAALARTAPAPAGRVAVAKCPDYGSGLEPAMAQLFDQIGGIGTLVNGKTVAIKINLTGSPVQRLGYAPLEDTHYTHPRVIAAACHLFARAGARRIRVLESPWSTAEPLEEYIMQANWEPRDILGAGPVEFENTNWLGRGKQYSRLWTPGGGHMFKGFDLNHSYEDCDVFVSIAKLKEHITAGITLSIKNCFGITPATVYGTGAGADEPSILPKGGRSLLHYGNRQPSKTAPSEKHPDSPRNDGWRIPRIVADLSAARPIHLQIIDGIRTMTGGEGPWVPRKMAVVSPGVLIAGTNCVSTDAVGMAVMGFDPMADRGTAPFETCDNTLKLAEELGVGTRDLSRIEVAGTQIRDAIFKFRT